MFGVYGGWGFIGVRWFRDRVLTHGLYGAGESGPSRDCALEWLLRDAYPSPRSEILRECPELLKDACKNTRHDSYCIVQLCEDAVLAARNQKFGCAEHRRSAKPYVPKC